MFAERLKELRLSHNMQQKELAKKLFVDASTVSQWERGKAKPDYQKQQMLADLFDVSLDYLAGRTDIDTNVEPMLHANGTIRIPILGRIPAGIPVEAIEDILDYEEAPAEWARGGKQFFGLRLKGDSMSPEYRNGDTVIFKSQPTCENGDDCAVMVNGNDATFKRVFRNEKGIVLQPLNPAYAPLTYTNDEIASLPVRILGVAWEIRRKMR